MEYSITQTFDLPIPTYSWHGENVHGPEIPNGPAYQIDGYLFPQRGLLNLSVPFTVREIRIKNVLYLTGPYRSLIAYPVPPTYDAEGVQLTAEIPRVFHMSPAPSYNNVLLHTDLNNHVPNGSAMAMVICAGAEQQHPALNSYFGKILYDNPKYINGTYNFWFTLLDLSLLDDLEALPGAGPQGIIRTQLVSQIPFWPAEVCPIKCTITLEFVRA